MLVPYVRRNLSSFDPFRELDDGSEYLLEADLPGVKKEDIQLDLTDNILTIKAERHSEYEEKDKKGNYVRCERSFGSYQRSFDTTGIDVDKIDAEFKDGVLKLTMPKLVEQKPEPKKLTIR